MEIAALLDLLVRASPAMAFGLLALWFLNESYKDRLRREEEWIKFLKATVEAQLQYQKEHTEAQVHLRTEVHALKNVVQNLIFSLSEGERRRRPGQELGST